MPLPKDTPQEMIITRLYDIGFTQLFKELNIKYVERGKESVKFTYNGYDFTISIKKSSHK